MKRYDIIIYLCLIGFGFVFGWFFKGEFSSIENLSKEVEPLIGQNKVSKNENNAFIKAESLPIDNDSEKQNLPKPKKVEVETKSSEIVPQEVPIASTKDSKVEVNKPVISKHQNDLDTIQKLVSRNDFLGAIRLLYYNRNSDSFADSLDIITNFVQTKVKQKENQNILADIERSLGFYPGWWPLIVLKGNVYVAMGEYEEGAKNLNGEKFYVKNDKDLAELNTFVRLLRSKRIEQLKQQRLTERLIAYYEELILEDSAFAQYYFELGRLYAEKNDFYSALVMLKIIVADETYGKDAAELIAQITAFQELEAAKQIVKLENKNAIEIPIVRVNDRVFVFVHLNEKVEAKFLVDTGATISMVTFNMASKLGFNASQLKDLRWFQTAGGMVKQPVIKLTTLTIANVKMFDLMVSVNKETGGEFDGILGMNFLSKFNFEINLERNLLILRQK